MLIFDKIIDFLTSIFQFFGNSIPAFFLYAFLSLVAIFYCYKKSLIRFNLFDSLFVLFSFFFLLSIIFRKAPFGFIEYSGLFSTYFFYKFFQAKPLFLSKIIFPIISGLNILTILAYLTSNFNRLFGFTNFNQSLITYPNLWALISGVLLILNLKTERYFFILTTAIVFFLTLSKTSFISFFIVFSILLISEFSKKSFKNLFPILITLLFAFILSVGILKIKNTDNYALDRISGNSISSQNSFQQRFIFFNQSLDMFFDYPFLGVGPGNFKSLQPSYASEFYTLSNHPHNLELKILAENGLFAGIILFISILIILALNLRNFTKPEFLAFLFILGQSQFDFNLNFVATLLILAYLLTQIIRLKLRESKLCYKFFNFILIQFIIVIMLSSLDYLDSKIHNHQYFFMNQASDFNFQKFPNYWAFNPEKFVELTPYDNLDIHFNYTTQDYGFNKDYYTSLINQVIDKTKLNYNFLVLDNQIPFALKIACQNQMLQLFDELKLAYIQELGKLNLKNSKQKYENITCN